MDTIDKHPPGRDLRQARLRRGLNLDQVAAALDVGRNAYRALEVERDRIPSPTIAERLAAVLDVDRAELAALYGYLPPGKGRPRDAARYAGWR